MSDDGHNPGRTRLMSRRTALQIGAAAAMSSSTAAFADKYPSGPITLIIPLPPGTVLDLTARIASVRIKKDLGQPFVVENVPGASGNVGVARAAHSRPDGQTVLFTISSPVSTNSFLMKDMPFDVDRDLSPVIMVGTAPVTLVVHESFPAKSVAEYIAYAKAHPGQVSYGSSGVGSPQHLCAEYLQALTDIKLTHIPYKGTPESANDVIAGHIPSAFTSLSLVYQQAKAGLVRVLAICDDQRSPLAPEIPTVRETVPKFVHAPSGWQAMFVPAHTPQEIIDTLNHEMNLVVKDPELSNRLKGQFTTFIGGEPQVVTERIRYEREVTGAIVKRIGLVPH